jgi:hypothetical protein
LLISFKLWFTDSAESFNLAGGIMYSLVIWKQYGTRKEIRVLVGMSFAGFIGEATSGLFEG